MNHRIVIALPEDELNLFTTTTGYAVNSAQYQEVCRQIGDILDMPFDQFSAKAATLPLFAMVIGEREPVNELDHLRQHRIREATQRFAVGIYLQLSYYGIIRQGRCKHFLETTFSDNLLFTDGTP